jgi:two-component system nitrogen regulation response regulator NtrX
MSHVYTILLVDDEINVARTLQMVFEAEGYVVSVAYSAKEAMAMFTGGLRADVVITDLNMEKDDIGLDVARAAQELTPRPIVVICTGYANVENSTLALEMRVDYLVTKPVDLDDLKSALLTMLARRGSRRVKSTRKMGAKMGANANG